MFYDTTTLRQSTQFSNFEEGKQKKNGEHVSIGITKQLTFMIQFDKIIAKIDSASRRTFSKFIYYLPEYISSAFKKENIKSGWHKCGLYPVDVVKILKFWPDFDVKFKAIPQNNGKLECFLEAIKTMTKIGFQRGYITDAEIIKYTDKISNIFSRKNL
jgi:hypothetical protein